MYVHFVRVEGLLSEALLHVAHLKFSASLFFSFTHYPPVNLLVGVKGGSVNGGGLKKIYASSISFE